MCELFEEIAKLAGQRWLFTVKSLPNSKAAIIYATQWEKFKNWSIKTFEKFF